MSLSIHPRPQEAVALLDEASIPINVERTLRDALARIRFGSVEVQIHEGRIVQIECREKHRFQP